MPSLTWIGATSRPCGARNLIFGLWANLIPAVWRRLSFWHIPWAAEPAGGAVKPALLTAGGASPSVKSTTSILFLSHQTTHKTSTACNPSPPYLTAVTLTAEFPPKQATPRSTNPGDLKGSIILKLSCRKTYKYGEIPSTQNLLLHHNSALWVWNLDTKMKLKPIRSTHHTTILCKNLAGYCFPKKT